MSKELSIFAVFYYTGTITNDERSHFISILCFTLSLDFVMVLCIVYLSLFSDIPLLLTCGHLGA